MSGNGTFETVIRNAVIVDGSGKEGVRGDIGIVGDRIVAVGEVSDAGTVEIDAAGRIVTPGFVDIHTHYDGQAVWDSSLAPSSSHGVTTVVTGNCGVGFAPCRAADRQGLIALMEGVEDIPGAAMQEGLSWEWETFEDYLDLLAERCWDADVCALLPHAPLRVWVMGKRALDLEAAAHSDIAAMRAIVTAAIRAGAFGVSTSRSLSHRSRAGSLIPTLRARADEITGLLEGIRDADRGVLQFVTGMASEDALSELKMLGRAVADTDTRAMFSLVQHFDNSEMYRAMLQYADQVITDGTSLRAIVAPRPVGMLLGLGCSHNPFSGTKAYREISHLPLARRVAILRDPAMRARILGEGPSAESEFVFADRTPYENMFKLSDPPNYAPERSQSLETLAAASNRQPAEVAYDALLENEGSALLYVPLANFAPGPGAELAACEEMLANPNCVFGLGDGGAHVGFICDASFPTYLLTYWVKERQRFSLGEAIRRLTSDTAAAIGLTDRGLLTPGRRADLNIIDLDRLQLRAPHMAHDLPTGGGRLLQEAVGYDLTMVAGEVTLRDGIPTGRRPGRLVRSTPRLDQS